MSKLSTPDKTEEFATCGVPRESVPLHSAASENRESSSEEEGEIQKDPQPGKRRHSPEEQSPAKRIKGPEFDTFNFSDILHVRNRLHCMIGVNDLKPFGAFAGITEGWMVRMFMDPGRFGSPSITLGFSKDGGKDICRSTWDVDSYVQGDWAMNDITFSRLYDQDPLDFDQSDYQAFIACETKERHFLFSMKFRSWKRVIGFDHLSKKESEKMPNNCRRSMRAIFHPEDSYTLTIWFKAPYNVVLFQRDCLGYFTRALAARKSPLYGFVDNSGVNFTALRNRHRKRDFASNEDQIILAPKASTTSDFRKEGKADEFVSSTGDTMEVKPTRQPPDLRLKALQPTSELRPGLNESDMEGRRQRETPTSPQPFQADSPGTETVLLDLEDRPKGSTIPEDQTELILTTERSSPTRPREENNATSSVSFLQDESPESPRTYGGAASSLFCGLVHTDDESDECDGGGSGR